MMLFLIVECSLCTEVDSCVLALIQLILPATIHALECMYGISDVTSWELGALGAMVFLLGKAALSSLSPPP